MNLSRVVGILALICCIGFGFVFAPTHSLTPTGKKPNPQEVTLLVDLGDVLISTNSSRALWHAGVQNMLPLIVFGGNNPLKLSHYIKKQLFDFLDTLDANEAVDHVMKDEQGRKLPRIMCDWMKGLDNASVLKQVNERLATYECPALVKWMLTGLSTMTFTPEIFSKTQYVHQPMLDFLKKRKAEGYKLFVLSNLNHEVYIQFCTDFPELFESFDPQNIIISGIVGHMKPEEDLYRYLESEHAVDFTKTIIFDDIRVNIEIPETRYGAHGILITKGKFADIEERFNQRLDDIANGTHHLTFPAAVNA